MTVEMGSIAALAALLLLLTALQGATVPLTQGFKWGLGSRDEVVPQSPLQRRFARAVANHIEAMVIFVPLMGLIIARGLENDATTLGAWLVIVGRAAFIPLYLAGVFAWRSVAYGVGVAGMLIVLFQLVLE